MEQRPVKEKIVEGPRRAVRVELPNTGDLRTAATLIANSEMNVNDLSTDEILKMLQELSEEDVNKQLGGFGQYHCQTTQMMTQQTQIMLRGNNAQ